MTIRSAIKMSACALILCGPVIPTVAHAQGQAPFTIRKPPDGATVRETVKIEIPRDSIGPGGFVAIYLDGKFQVAVAPEKDAESTGHPFTYAWDTKAAKVKDGDHTVRAVLYEPNGDNSAAEKGSTEVKVTVANKIHDGPASLLLRYKDREGEALDYDREGRSIIVGLGTEQGTTTSDHLLADVKSQLRYDVQDVRHDEDYGTDIALVRNKLTQLSVLQSGQEVTLDPGQLSNSMYQEISPLGKVFYEIGAASGLAEFMAVGLPVNNTLELPELPTNQVQVGDTWTTEHQRLDIPGVPPALQPRVTLNNTLVDLEWENGYPTACIHQVYGKATPPGTKSVQFGPVLVTSPAITFERDIYIAYTSGKLVRMVRTLKVEGRTANSTNAEAPAGGMGPGGPAGGGGPAAGGGVAGAARRPGSAGGSPDGARQSSGSGSPYGGQSGSPYGGRQPGAGGPPSGSSPYAGRGPGGPAGASGSPYGGGNGGGYSGGNAPPPTGGVTSGMSIADIIRAHGGGGGGGGSTEPDHRVVLQAVTDTRLLTVVSNGASSSATTVSHTTTHHSKKSSK